MRIKFYTLVIVIFGLFLLLSCEDVINSDPNFKRKYPDYNVGEEQKVTFWKWQLCGYT